MEHYCQSVRELLNLGEGFFVEKTAAWNESNSTITYTLEKYKEDDDGNRIDSST